MSKGRPLADFQNVLFMGAYMNYGLKLGCGGPIGEYIGLNICPGLISGLGFRVLISMAARHAVRFWPSS